LNFVKFAFYGGAVMNGIFIAIDGQEGVGKTTFLAQLNSALKEKGLNVYVTKEPTINPIGKLIKNNEFNGLILAQLVAADRILHLEDEIKPALEVNDIVLTDRYLASSYVYQIYDGVDADTIKMLNKEIIRPNINVFLSADISIIKDRIKARGEKKGLTKLDISISAEKMADLFTKSTRILCNDGFENIEVLLNNSQADMQKNISYMLDIIDKTRKGIK
jgi:dTMP kinase